jgi:hypothetical protein
MKRQKNIVNTRFAACADPARRLNLLVDAARRAITGGRFWEFDFSTGGHFRDSFIPLMSNDNLTRHEIFRGKISRRNNQTQNKITTSMKGRSRAKIHEQP